jgi:hypothetical protein
MKLMSLKELELEHESTDEIPSLLLPNHEIKDIYDNDRTIGACWQNGFAQDWFNKRMAEIQQLNFSSSRNKHRNKLKQKLINSLENKLIRIWNDQTCYDDTAHRHIEPYQVIVEIDRITNDGIGRIAELVTGESTGYFGWYAYGEGTTAPRLSDFQLEFERARVPIITRGYRSASGTIVKHGASFSKTFPNANVTESTVSDMPTNIPDQSILFRVVFPVPLPHEVNRDVISLAHALFFSSGRDLDPALDNG